MLRDNMTTTDGKHFEVVINGPSEPPPELSGSGDVAGRIEHQTIFEDERTGPGSGHLSAASVPITSPQIAERIPSVNPTLHFIEDPQTKTEDIVTSQAQVSSQRRGRMQMRTFLGLGEPSLGDRCPASVDVVAAQLANEAPKPEDAEQPSYSMQLAQNALLRTRNFLEFMLSRTPPGERRELEVCIEKMLVPRNLPDMNVLHGFEYFARSYGYYGPILWFIPAGIKLADLHGASLLSDDLWIHEANFIKGYPSQYPFEVPSEFNAQYIGYWILALPGIMPGTTCRSYSEQLDMMCYLAQTVGLKTKNGLIRAGHHMLYKIPNIVDLLVFYGIATHAKALVSRAQLIVRSSISIRAYADSKQAGDPTAILLPKHGLFNQYRASALVDPSRKLSVTESIDDQISQGHGITPFFVSRIYL